MIVILFSGCSTQTPYIPPPQVTPVIMPKTIHEEITPVRPVIPQKEGFYHKVEKGETLWGIAKKYDVTVYSIAQRNRLPDVTYVEIGQMLYIPSKAGQSTKHFYANDILLLPSEAKFIWPLKGKILYHFGSIINGAKNKGIDIKTSNNAYVKAAKSGIVSYEGTKIKGLGKMIIIDHRDNFQTIYAFNNENLVQVGMKVKQGDIIAHAGTTGRTQIPSLHFEIRKKSIPHNPLVYLD